jgi:RNA polymerase sigma-70 factor (ECF subfamily)
MAAVSQFLPRPYRNASSPSLASAAFPASLRRPATLGLRSPVPTAEATEAQGPDSGVFLVAEGPSAPPQGRAQEGHSADADLALRAARGEASAQSALVKRYTALVKSKLRACLGSQDLEDHVQETFLRFFERLHVLREPNAVGSFLVGIALRVASTELRRRRHARERVTETGDLPEVQGYTDDFLGREAVRRLDQVLASLSPEARALFQLRFVDELELVDVARSTGTSLATAKRHLSKASTLIATLVAKDAALADYHRPSSDCSIRRLRARSGAEGTLPLSA